VAALSRLPASRRALRRRRVDIAREGLERCAKSSIERRAGETPSGTSANSHRMSQAVVMSWHCRRPEPVRPA
jgi:hypothetical protein